MGRPEKPITSSGPVADLARALRDLRARARNPSYTRLSGLTNYSRAVLNEAAAGNRRPTWEVTVSFVQACGVDPADVRSLWERADHAQRVAMRAERFGNVSPMSRRKQAGRRAAAPDPWRATTPAGYIHQLRALRAWGGNPGVWEVDLAGRRAPGGRWLSSSSFYDALNERRSALPPLRLVQALVTACGGDVAQWTQAWQALSLAEFERANPAPAELSEETTVDATVHALRPSSNAG
jgi:Helix-turn-helix domain